MTVRRVLAATACTLTMAGLLVVGTTGTASAGIPGIARANVVFSGLFNLSGVLVGVRVCGSGNVDDGPYLGGGTWVFSVTGVRDNGNVIRDTPLPFGGPSFSYCYNVYFDGASTGLFDVHVSFAAASLDVTSAAGGQAGWAFAVSPSPFWQSFGV